jgi:hypothetical protein
MFYSMLRILEHVVFNVRILEHIFNVRILEHVFNVRILEHVI